MLTFINITAFKINKKSHKSKPDIENGAIFFH